MSFESSPFNRLPVDYKSENAEVSSLQPEVVENDCISSESFLEQILAPKTIRLEDKENHLSNEASYVEIKPERLTSEECVVYIGGLGTNALAYDAQLHELARRGRKIIYINPVEGIKPSRELAEYADAHEIPQTIQNKAAEIELLMCTLNVGKVDVVGHSQGGAIATLLTAFRPNQVDRLVLDTPAGLVGNKSAGSLISRSIEEAGSEYQYAKQKFDAGDPSYLDAWKKRIFNDERGDASRLLWRLTTEIKGIGQTNIVPLLQDIQAGHRQADEATLAPEVILLTAQNDRVFKAEEIATTMTEHGLAETKDDGTRAGIVDSWAMYADRRAGHGFLTKNDPKLLAELVSGSSRPEDEPNEVDMIVHFIMQPDRQLGNPDLSADDLKMAA